jgi:hypothetical protein
VRNVNAGFLAASCWAAFTLFVVWFTDDKFVRTIAAGPLLLFIPGHMLLKVLGYGELPGPQHVIYAIGASIGLCVAGGFLLHLGGFLTPTGWALWLAALTWVATLLSWRRADRPAATVEPPMAPGFERWHPAALGLALLMTCAAYGLALRDAEQQREFNYTGFWLLSGGPETSSGITVGIRSGEAERRVFDVEVRLDGQTIALWRSIGIAPGATWTRRLAVPPGRGKPRKAEGWLYEPADNAVYRKVSTVLPGA